VSDGLQPERRGAKQKSALRKDGNARKVLENMQKAYKNDAFSGSRLPFNYWKMAVTLLLSAATLGAGGAFGGRGVGGGFSAFSCQLSAFSIGGSGRRDGCGGEEGWWVAFEGFGYDYCAPGGVNDRQGSRMNETIASACVTRLTPYAPSQIVSKFCC